MGTMSCMNLPTTSGFPRSISVRFGGDSLVVFGGGSLASCGLSAGVGVAIPDAGTSIAVVEDEGVDTNVVTVTNAYSCACCA